MDVACRCLTDRSGNANTKGRDRLSIIRFSCVYKMLVPGGEVLRCLTDRLGGHESDSPGISSPPIPRPYQVNYVKT